MNQQLNKKGYIHFKGLMSKEFVQNFITQNIKEKKVMYSGLTLDIVDKILPSVQRKLGWKLSSASDSNHTFIKYRLSDNNNADAAGSHRDGNFQGTKKNELLPLYTCVAYFDSATMELMPGSHRSIKQDHLQAVSNWNEYIRIQLEPGDVLLFSAYLIHRGIFTYAKHRRVLQIFDLFKSVEEKNKYQDQILHVQTVPSPTAGWLMTGIAKISPLMTCLNSFFYMNAATGYGQIDNQKRIKGFTTISSDGICPYVNLDQIKPYEYYPINIYIYMTKNVKRADPVYSKFIQSECYKKEFIRLILFILFIILIIVCIVYLIKSKK